MAGIVINSASSGLPPAPPGYRWENGKLVPQTQVVTDANGQQQTVAVAPPLQEGTDGSQFDEHGKIIASYGPDGMPVGGAVLGEDTVIPADKMQTGQSIMMTTAPDSQGQTHIVKNTKNDHGTLDYQMDNGPVRPGASAPSTRNADGSYTPAPVNAGGDLGHSVARNLDPAGVFDYGNGFFSDEDMHVGGVLDPANLSGWDKGNGGGGGVLGEGGALGGVSKAVGDAASAVGGLLGGSGGPASGATPGVDPNAYVVAGDPNYAKNIGDQARALGFEEEQNLRNIGAAASDYGQTQGANIAGIGTRGREDLVGLEATEGPSAALAQLQTASEANMANSLALARSGRNGTNTNAERGALFQNAATGAQTAQQYAALRAQENAAWRSRQASNMAQGYGLEANTATSGASTGLAGMKQNEDAASQGADQRFKAENTAATAAALGYDASSGKVHEDTTRYGIDKGQQIADADRSEREKMGLVGAAVGGLGMLAASDIRGKKDLRSAGDVAAQYAALGGPQSWEYKDPNAPGAAPGRFVSPMAQELERLPATANAVSTGPDGMKQVDTGRVTMTNTSVLGQHQRELERLKAQVAALTGSAGGR